MSTIVRKIKLADNTAMAAIIRSVMPEFGAGGAGFAIHDTEVDNLFEAYAPTNCAYFVYERDGKIIGGGGVAPLLGGDKEYCELKKMYFLPEGRGTGSGQQTLLTCIEEAKAMGYRYCYLETFNTMTGAMKLYGKTGFKTIPHALGNTGHFACDRFYLLEL